MNRKLALLIGILAVFTMKMMAQDFRYGVYIGIGGNNIKITDELYYDDSETITRLDSPNGVDTVYTAHYLHVDNAKVEFMPAFSFGGYYEMPISDIVGLQIHLLYNQSGYTLKGKVDQPNVDDEFSVEYDYEGTLKRSNLNASILLKFNLPYKDLSIEAGLTPGYCIKMTKEAKRGALHKNIHYKKDEYNPIDLSGTLGVTYYLFDSFMFAAKLNIGLLDVLKVKEPYISQDPNDNPKVQYGYSTTSSQTVSLYFSAGYRF